MAKTYTIIIICILFAVGAFIALSNVASPQEVKPEARSYGEVGGVELGQILRFTDFSLKLTEIESDSRCPKDVNCIWAGTVTVKAEFITPTGTTTKTIELGKATQFGNFEVLLFEVEPNKKAA